MAASRISIKSDEYLKMMISPDGIVIGEARGRYAISAFVFAIAIITFHIWA